MYDSFSCIWCLWILFPCLYLDNHCFIWFFILSSGKDLLFFIKKSISCFNISSTSLNRWKKNDLGFLHNHVFFHDYNDLIKISKTFLVILLCRYKRYSICLIYYLICMNCFELLFALIILENWLIIYLKLKI